ncbi:MAG: hypothetical protein JWN04_6226 [Myxococcaceae bacterium]|nr:hypothetical protein [Myxococcaceae bacterium]
MIERMNRFAAAAALVGLSIGCGGAKKTEAETAGKANAELAPVAAKSTWQPAPLPDEGAIKLLGISGPEDKAWDKMNYEEKEWYMVGKVHPVMRQVFQTFNEKKYEGEKFECTPCHGENPEQRKYKMPSAHLAAIPAYGSTGWHEMENTRLFKFMDQRVTPSMGKLLGKEAWNPQTGEGYSCWGCHPKAD